MGVPVRCAVNPKLGKEMQLQRIPAQADARLIAIVGGGPAGMQTALSAAERGCRSVIFERDETLGGKLILAAGVEYKQDIRRYLQWLRDQVDKNELIEVRLGTEATEGLIRQLNPDAVVVAAGSEPNIPAFPGQELNNVLWFGDVDTGTARVGERVVLIGGGPSGAETALQLAREGKAVTLVDRNPAERVKGRWVKCLDTELADNGVEFRFQSQLSRVTETGAVIVDSHWREEELPADTIILSLGFKPNTETAEALRGIAPDTFVIGDCKKVDSVMQAVHDGFNVASII